MATTHDPGHEQAAAQVVDAFVSLADESRRRADTAIPSDDDLARAVTAAVRLYADRAEQTGQHPAPLTPDATATDAIVAVAEMMRFADLNAFDVNMWLSRRA
ncbi:MAG: hypothetical protein QF664_02915 [Dehalococcoidia bacterium]|jgi:hypothetical protein|nr:hypothetical protein [Dehalococcoidia bacterium]